MTNEIALSETPVIFEFFRRSVIRRTFPGSNLSLRDTPINFNGVCVRFRIRELLPIALPTTRKDGGKKGAFGPFPHGERESLGNAWGGPPTKLWIEATRGFTSAHDYSSLLALAVHTYTHTARHAHAHVVRGRAARALFWRTSPSRSPLRARYYPREFTNNDARRGTTQRRPSAREYTTR